MNSKQNGLFCLAANRGIDILNIEDYKNKDSVISCQCAKCASLISGTVTQLTKTGFECLECLSTEALDITDHKPFFLSLDAATYTTGMAIFNREGQMLGHHALSISKGKDYFTRLREIKAEITRVIEKNDIKVIVLEDIQYQQNPVLFKKLAMLQGVIRYTIIEELGLELFTAMADEWRSYNHIGGTKRAEQKRAAIDRATRIFKTAISEDESEAIFLGYYGIHLYNQSHLCKEE